MSAERTRAAPSRRRVVVFSFLVDLFDVATNLVVAVITGSAVVFSEMAQGVADSVGSGLLVVGDRRSSRPVDPEHPHGYRREAFFWAVLSALAMLFIGAGLSAWRGLQQLTDPSDIDNSPLAIAVLVVAICTNSYAVLLSVRNLTGRNGSLREAIRGGGQPLVKGALLRDVIGTTTSIVGLAALVLYQVSDRVVFDSVGALAAAVMMTGAAIVLIIQARDLIAGRSLPQHQLAQLMNVLVASDGVDAVNRLVAVHAGTDHVDVDVDLDLADDLDTGEIEQLLDELEARARQVVPELTTFHVDLNSPTSRAIETGDSSIGDQ